ncbi:Imm71 family immunity protein [Dyella japonica]|uniref:Immunity protein 72 n=1 Tax=Dyella japonica TaxID=231455 RepID=A0ABV2K1E4_9GAMM
MSVLPTDVLLPNERERQQIFYWLQRISSYTAWSRILGYYHAWAKVTEKSVQAASERGWSQKSSVSESDLVMILKGLAHCEEGVRRLRQGDKRVFKYDANGEFVMARSALSVWSTKQYRVYTRDTSIDTDHTPYWPEFEYAFEQLIGAWRECATEVIEPERLDAPSPTIYGVWLQEWLPKMTFPRMLPEVPDPAKHTLIATGKITPCSGIWEPVEVPKPKGFHLFGNAPPPEGPLPMVGCMAYLHGGSPAPRAKQETETESLRADVTWRLLWRDDRYEDGTVPEEESTYVFLKPDPSLAAPEPEELRGGMRVWSDTPCPYPGVWQCLDKPLGPQTVAFGVPMPRVQGERVLWRLMKAV